MIAVTPPRITERAHAWIAPALRPGARVVDATAGNGADTSFLARAVSPGGVVHAFDVQARALFRARRRLQTAAPDARVVWHRASHERVPRHLGDTPIDAAMFNLGWLPGGDRARTTRPESTVAALAAVADRLAPGGRLSVVAYRGHPGGAEEDAAVAAWVEGGAGGLEAQPPDPASRDPRAPVLYRLATPGGVGPRGAS